MLVAGATGFAGALAAHLLWRHPDFELAGVTAARSSAGAWATLYPRYRVPLVLEQLDLDALDGVDAAIVAYPHGSRRADRRRALRERGAARGRPQRRLPPALARDLRALVRRAPPPRAPRARPSTACTELHRERDRRRRASSPAPAATRPPRCSRSRPLARAGLIADVVIDAKQGVSGAGQASDRDHPLVTVAENIVPYGVAAHRHMPEIEQQLGALGCAARSSRAVPGAPAARSTRASSPAATSRRRAPSAPEELEELLRAPPTRTSRSSSSSTRPPGVRDVRETNFCAHLRRRRRAHRQAARVRARSTTSGREPPRRRCRTST